MFILVPFVFFYFFLVILDFLGEFFDFLQFKDCVNFTVHRLGEPQNVFFFLTSSCIIQVFLAEAEG